MNGELTTVARRPTAYQRRCQEIDMLTNFDLTDEQIAAVVERMAQVAHNAFVAGRNFSCPVGGNLAVEHAAKASGDGGIRNHDALAAIYTKDLGFRI